MYAVLNKNQNPGYRWHLAKVCQLTWNFETLPIQLKFIEWIKLLTEVSNSFMEMHSLSVIPGKKHLYGSWPWFPKASPGERTADPVKGEANHPDTNEVSCSESIWDTAEPDLVLGHRGIALAIRH